MCFMLTLNTNTTMQFGEPVHQGKSNSSLEVVTFPWISIFNIMNTLQEFAAKQPIVGKNFHYLSNNNFKAAC